MKKQIAKYGAVAICSLLLGSWFTVQNSSWPRRQYLKLRASSNLLDHQLWGAARAGNIEELQRLLQQGAAIDSHNYMGRTALHHAADTLTAHGTAKLRQQPRTSEAITLLVRAGADHTARDYFGMTPLHLAAQKVHLKNITALIEAGADTNATITHNHYKGYTPLHLACDQLRNKTQPYNSAVLALLQHTTDINAPTAHGRTALHFTAHKSRDTEIIMALLKAGASINARDSWGNTPLHFALRGNADNKALRYAILTTLLDAGADIQATSDDGETLLHLSSDDPLLTQFLLKRGLPVNPDTNHWRTPLHGVTSPEVLNILIAAGAKVNATTEREPAPIHRLAQFADDPKAIHIMAEAGAAINSRDRNGRTPLMNAVGSNSNVKVIEELIAAGADIRAVNNKGFDALWFSRFNKNKAVKPLIKYLLKQDPQ